MTTVRAVVCTGLHEPWKTEEIEIDPPGNREVRVQLAWSGMCHSDEHLRTGDISAPPEVLEMIGVKSMFPIVGGHEGSGIVTEVGPNVTQVAEGDHVAVAFIPSCGTCFWCASGRQNLCDLGMTTLAGGMISDGTYRYHLGGENLNRMTQLGTFAEEMVVHENSLVRINPWENMKAAALDRCGLATGFGSAVDRAKVKPGETVVVAGCGGVGSGAIQGARLAGARHIIAVDPVPFKLERATEIGATHTAASLFDAEMMLPELTMGRNADVVILTPGAAEGSDDRRGLRVRVERRLAWWSRPSRRSARWTSSSTCSTARCSNQSVLGTVFGSRSFARARCPEHAGICTRRANSRSTS